MIISLKMVQKNFSRTYSINHKWYGCKFFPKNILLFKVDSFGEFLNRCKIDGMVNDNSSSCNSKC